MNIFQRIRQSILDNIIRKATSNHMVDIVEVRTKEIRLGSVLTETDIRITNTFFLPVTILSIHTELRNRDGMKVGRMKYDQPRKLAGHSQQILTTTSEVSIITSLFQALSTLLMQPVKMQSVGIARVKWLWWTFDIPVDDRFEIHPGKLKIVKEETEEERQARKQKERAWREERERRKQARTARAAKPAVEEELPAEREVQEEVQAGNIQEEAGPVELTLDAEVIERMAAEETEEPKEEDQAG